MPEKVIERREPHSIEAEAAVLGAMMMHGDAVGRIVELLGNETLSFYHPSHQKIYGAMLSLFDLNKPIDLVTLSEELRRRKELDSVGGSPYLATLMEQITTSANVEYYGRIVLEKSLARKVIQAGTTIVQDGFKEGEDADALLDRAESLIFSIKEKRLREGFVPLKSLIHGTFEAVETLYDQKKHVTGIETGFKDLDMMTSGLQPSDLVVIASRPSMGKTSFALNIAQYVAIEQKLPVAIFSLETSKEQIAQRLFWSEARVDAHRFRTGFLSEGDWPKLTHAAGLLSEAPIWIDDTPAISVLELRAKARRLKGEADIGMIIVDYLQLMTGPRNSENRQQEISSISRSLKALAKELRMPLLALSQLSRAVEMRGGDHRRPLLSDLRESGAIEQDADVVLFIYRPEFYGKEPRGVAELIIAKQRNGPTGTKKFTFIKEYIHALNPRLREKRHLLKRNLES
jgi:replicative DNA helicase